MSLERSILDALSQPDYRPMRPSALAKTMRIKKTQLDAFRTALDQLIATDRVRKTPDGVLRRVGSRELLQGTIKKAAGGFGFLIQKLTKPPSPDAPPVPDIYIAAEDLGEAHTGDEVLVQLVKGGRHRQDSRARGRVVEILTRTTRVFVGTYLEIDGQSFVQVDGTTLNAPVPVGDPGAKGAQPGDKVVFEMLRFPSHAAPGEGVLTKVLGPRGEPGVDTQSIIHEFALPDEFPDDVLADARHQAEHFDENNITGRTDLTNELIITIDPVDARDFDDAISLTKDERGNWRLGVHIADVGHFVQPGSALDTEAALRGTSVYLPDRVLPMLPEIISNGLASLQPGRVRLTKSAFIEYSPDGVVHHVEFANSFIRSAKRFAYEEVMPIIEHPEQHSKIPVAIRKLLADMYELAMVLRKRRYAAGSLELSLPEVKLDFDKQIRVTGAHVVPHDPSHQIIEEFMLAANMAVATALHDLNIPFMRRVHADPDEIKLRAFAMFVSALGYPLKKFQSRAEMQRVLREVEGTPHVQAVNYGLLRSLKQAEYTPEPLGHFALAAEHYCHFTSPIRRYPDLTIHRLIGQLVEQGKIDQYPGEVELDREAQHCSRTERRAEQAERELVKVKLLTFLANKIGLEMDAVITGAQEWGFFCQGIDLPAEGLVSTESLDDDFYYLDPVTHSLIGRRSGRQFRLGDRVRVVVAVVDVNRRQLNFRLAGSRAANLIKENAANPQAVPVDGRSSRPSHTRRAPAGRTAESRPSRGRRKPSSGPPKKGKPRKNSRGRKP